MDFSISHIGVRTRPALVVDVVVRVDGKTIQVGIDDDVVEHLCGTGVRDEKTILLAINRNARAILIAVESYVYARGVPLDDHFVLSRDDFSPSDQAPAVAGASVN